MELTTQEVPVEVPPLADNVASLDSMISGDASTGVIEVVAYRDVMYLRNQKTGAYLSTDGETAHAFTRHEQIERVLRRCRDCGIVISLSTMPIRYLRPVDRRHEWRN